MFADPSYQIAEGALKRHVKPHELPVIIRGDGVQSGAAPRYNSQSSIEDYVKSGSGSKAADDPERGRKSKKHSRRDLSPESPESRDSEARATDVHKENHKKAESALRIDHGNLVRSVLKHDSRFKEASKDDHWSQTAAIDTNSVMEPENQYVQLTAHDRD